MGAAVGTDDKKSVNVELNVIPFIDLMSCLTAFLLVTAVWTQFAQINIKPKGHGREAKQMDDKNKIYASILVTADVAEFQHVAAVMEGQLTATVFASKQEIVQHAALLRGIERKVGRLIFNGVPTGVEVSHAMQHGGPYPASTDARSTSVGSAAISRFARPVCYQNFPEEVLPPELQAHNPLRIWRLVDGQLTRDPL